MSGERVLVNGSVGSANLLPGKLFVGDGWGVNAYLTFREGRAAEWAMQQRNSDAVEAECIFVSVAESGASHFRYCVPK